MSDRTSRLMLLLGAAIGLPAGYLTGLIADEAWRTATLGILVTIAGIASIVAVCTSHGWTEIKRADAEAQNNERLRDEFLASRASSDEGGAP